MPLPRPTRPSPRSCRTPTPAAITWPVFRDLSRRAFAATDDAVVRARYEDASYSLCVMVGHRMVHHAISTAEQPIAVRRLDGAPVR
ncbi:DUF5133 domain-containing protein [Streptomyces sp. NPDC002120]|uniref:DUF5133 domain-containing protein n=1 Tax=Streptomyces sp. NPDC002120 TaxID=3364631 RepID=UPI0036C485A1